MTSKLPFFALIEKIQTGRITEKEIGQYFLVQRHPTRPFDFLVGINPERIDLTNVESAGALAKPLLHDASVLLDLRHQFRSKSAASFARKSPIIAEGDSWFRLPSVPLVPDTLVDELSKKYSLINLAEAGDTLSNMIVKGEFWPRILPDQNGNYRSDTLMFSGGGNDILGGEAADGGGLWRFLRVFDVNHTDPADAPYYIKDEFYRNLDRLVGVPMALYDMLIQQIEYRAPKVIVVTHGYDYVVPKRGGRSLFQPMSRQGLRPDVYPKLCDAILKIMIDAFNGRLAALESAHPSNFKYVDLSGTLNPKTDWWDELHAKTAGAKKLAAKYAKALDALPAAKAMAPPIAMAYPHRLKGA